MNLKTGRNAPCPCGSGRKFKHCHGRPTVQTPDADPAKAISIVLLWLEERHRKAFKAELEYLTLDAFWPDESPDPAAVPGEYWEMIAINVQEWLLADGAITVKNQRTPVVDLVLRPGGPRLAPCQQDFLRELAARPLRLYEVTESRPGEGLTLVDIIDHDVEPQWIQEHTASHSLAPGDLLGARLLKLDGHLELSGALYPFTRLHAGALRPLLDEFIQDVQAESLSDKAVAFELGHLIVEQWFVQMTLPAPVPQFMDASTSEPMMLTTDYFQIVDRAALDEKLADCPELEVDGDDHWVWLESGADGLVRARLSLSIEPESPNQIELFCRTLKLADQGRTWFETMAGDAVKHLKRESTDPHEAMSKGNVDHSFLQAPEDPPDLPPEEMTRLVQEALEKTYADWADQPLPALDDRSPREAMTSSNGLERVKGLLRSYEHSENKLAPQQGRHPASLQFLWDALGITRE